MAIDYELLGQRIREARIKAGMTQATFSGIIGLLPSHYAHIESGKAKINLPTLVAIEQALDTTIDLLLYDSIPVLIDSYDKDFKNARAMRGESYQSEASAFPSPKVIWSIINLSLLQPVPEPLVIDMIGEASMVSCNTSSGEFENPRYASSAVIAAR